MKRNMKQWLADYRNNPVKKAMPILSFPGVQIIGHTVEELVKSGELQAQCMKAISDRFDTGVAFSLMDLSVEAEAFGAQIRFSDDEVPVVIGQLVSDEDEANDLEVPTLEAGRALTCVEGVRLAKERITDKPVIAGMIGPYSLAGRLMDVTEIMYICYDEPETVHIVLDKVTQYLIQYGSAMKAAGADAIMMAEPLAGILSPDMADEFSVPYVKRIIDALQDEEFAVIYHNCGNSVPSMLEQIYSQGAAAYHFGNAVDMEKIMEATASDTLCMGNIDPAGQFAHGTPESIREATKELLEKCGGYKNFVPSSGCDIPAHAKWENIQSFFQALEN